MLLIQDQLLRNVEPRLERIEVGVPVEQPNSLCNLLQDASLLLSLLTEKTYQYIDPLIQHLVAVWTIQLLSNIREDFLDVSSIGDLKQLYLCKLILYSAHRSPRA